MKRSGNDSRRDTDVRRRKSSASGPTQHVSRNVVRKILAAQQRERQQLLAAMVSIKGFMPLLMKPRNGERWSRPEREELTAQMRALAYLSPYLFVMVLPGSFLALPILAWWLDRRRINRDKTLTLN